MCYDYTQTLQTLEPLRCLRGGLRYGRLLTSVPHRPDALINQETLDASTDV